MARRRVAPVPGPTATAITVEGGLTISAVFEAYEQRGGIDYRPRFAITFTTDDQRATFPFWGSADRGDMWRIDDHDCARAVLTGHGLMLAADSIISDALYGEMDQEEYADSLSFDLWDEETGESHRACQETGVNLAGLGIGGDDLYRLSDLFRARARAEA